FFIYFFFFQAEDGIRDRNVTGVQTCALPICFNKLQSELLPNGVYVEYSYNRKNGYEIAESITYKNVTYYYIVDDNSIITGLLDRSEERRVGKECRCRRVRKL